jgi:hypothetical protein
MATKKRCFVISPIGAPGSDIRAHADDVFNYIIEPVAKQLGYDTERGDHMARPGRISDQMYERILRDDLLIAVLTFQNPNVYYELAIAHAAARPLIILCEGSHSLPFDIKDQRVIFYDLRPRSLFDGTYKKELEKAIVHLESGQIEPEVPFRPNLTPLGGLGESFRVFERFTDTVSAGSRGASIKILIMHEQNPALISMLNNDVKNYAHSVRDEITRSFEMWTDIGRKMRLSVRKVRQGIIYQQLFMSESRMIYTPYNMSTTTYYSATVQTDHRSPLYSAQKHEFDFLWERSEGEDTERPRPAAKRARRKRSRSRQK